MNGDHQSLTVLHFSAAQDVGKRVCRSSSWKRNLSTVQLRVRVRFGFISTSWNQSHSTTSLTKDTVKKRHISHIITCEREDSRAENDWVSTWYSLGQKVLTASSTWCHCLAWDPDVFHTGLPSGPPLTRTYARRAPGLWPSRLYRK